jgi:hypothetical protein
MVPSTLTHTSRAALTLTETPSLGQLQIWWEALQDDPTRYLVYTDFMPTEFEEFLAPVQQGAIQVHLMLVGPEVGGAFYLHDRGTDDTGAAYAWLGVYMLPLYRGPCAARAWRLVRQACERQGLYRICCDPCPEPAGAVFHHPCDGFHTSGLVYRLVLFRRTPGSRQSLYDAPARSKLGMGGGRTAGPAVPVPHATRTRRATARPPECRVVGEDFDRAREAGYTYLRA